MRGNHSLEAKERFPHAASLIQFRLDPQKLFPLSAVIEQIKNGRQLFPGFIKIGYLLGLFNGLFFFPQLPIGEADVAEGSAPDFMILPIAQNLPLHGNGFFEVCPSFPFCFRPIAQMLQRSGQLHQKQGGDWEIV